MDTNPTKKRKLNLGSNKFNSRPEVKSETEVNPGPEVKSESEVESQTEVKVPKRKATEKEKQQRSLRNKRKNEARKKEEAGSSSKSKKRPNSSDRKPNLAAYKILCRLLLQIIEDNPDIKDIKGYNLLTWLSIIKRIAIDIANDEDDDMELNCWETNFSVQTTGEKYQQLSLYPYKTDEDIVDILKQAKDMKTVHKQKHGEQGNKKTEAPHRLSCFLGDYKNYKKGLSASHRCHNDLCCNPAHLIWELMENTKEKKQLGNRDRNGCRYGTYDLCPHNPKCIWTRDFKFLLCRNTPSFFNCQCDCDCTKK
jgi:hypothetical protein